MANVTWLLTFPKAVYVEAQIPISERDKFETVIVDRDLHRWIEGYRIDPLKCL